MQRHGSDRRTWSNGVSELEPNSARRALLDRWSSATSTAGHCFQRFRVHIHNRYFAMHFEKSYPLFLAFCRETRPEHTGDAGHTLHFQAAERFYKVLDVPRLPAGPCNRDLGRDLRPRRRGAPPCAMVATLPCHLDDRVADEFVGIRRFAPLVRRGPSIGPREPSRSRHEAPAPPVPRSWYAGGWCRRAASVV